MAIIAAHAVAYLFFVWKLYDNSVIAKAKEIGKNIRWKKNLIFFVFVLTFGYIARGFAEVALKQGIPEFWGASFWHNLKNTDNRYLFAFLVTFPTATQITHFIVDGIIWKVNKKPR